MFFDSIACLKVNGCGLIFNEPDVLNNIARTASDMIIKESKKVAIKSNFFEGVLTTKMEIGLVGSVVGHIFKIELEGEGINRVTMDFVLNRPLSEMDFKHGYWDVNILNEKTEKAQWN